MVNREVLIENVKKLSVREIYDYISLIQLLCRRYENMLKGYYGPIDNPAEPWVKTAKDNFNYYNEIYMEIMDHCENLIKDLTVEKEEPLIILNETLEANDKPLVINIKPTEPTIAVINDTNNEVKVNKPKETKKKNVKKTKK